MIAKAHELDLDHPLYVFDPSEAEAMTRAGAAILVAHMGVTVGGTIGDLRNDAAESVLRRCLPHLRKRPCGSGPTSSFCATAARSQRLKDAEFMMHKCRVATVSWRKQHGAAAWSKRR